MRCETLDRRLSDVLEDPVTFDRDLEAHVDECLRCRAELLRYRRLRVELAGLRPSPIGTVDGLLDDILGTLDASARARQAARRARQVTFAVVAAAGTLAALVALGRVRARRLSG